MLRGEYSRGQLRQSPNASPASRRWSSVKKKKNIMKTCFMETWLVWCCHRTDCTYRCDLRAKGVLSLCVASCLALAPLALFKSPYRRDYRKVKSQMGHSLFGWSKSLIYNQACDTHTNTHTHQQLVMLCCSPLHTNRASSDACFHIPSWPKLMQKCLSPIHNEVETCRCAHTPLLLSDIDPIW